MQSNWIGNRSVPSESKDAIAVINPATEETLGEIPRGSAGDVDQGVRARRQERYHALATYSRLEGS